MRFIWLIFVGLVLAMLGILPRLERQPPVARPGTEAAEAEAGTSEPARRAPVAAFVASGQTKGGLVRRMAWRDSIVFFALQQLGTNYCYAGTTPETGFDCSGFVQYVFNRFHVPVPHSTAMLIDVGLPVPREQALPGDIVVFTGTAPTATTPGHAGIIVTAGPGGPIRFVHSSSARRESGVKISQVEGTDYERRFMQVRRVLGPGMPKAVPRVARPAAPAPVPALPPPSVPPAVVSAPPAATTTAATRKPSTASRAKKVVSARKKTAPARKKAAAPRARKKARPVRRKATVKATRPAPKPRRAVR